MLLLNLSKFLLTDPNIKKSIHSLCFHSTLSTHSIDRWVVQLHDSIFHNRLEGGQPEWGGRDLTPTIHYLLYNLFLLVADIPFVKFSNSFLWKQLRFLKKP